MNPKPRVNYEIKIKEVRVIGPEGEQLGIFPTHVAIKKAEEQGFDLVEVSPTAKPPVCKMMDFGKYMYEQSKKVHAMKQHQKSGQIKEVKFRPHINEHDLETKINYVQRFLEDGNKAKISMMFRGREMIHTEVGKELLQKIIVATEGVAVLEVPPRMEGSNMTMTLAPATTQGKAGKTAGTGEKTDESGPGKS
ncbi:MULTISPECIES: translation initiation factor IF-3 [Leptospirillum]|uniref:translation initiation factor IF-3 n=1 Tax=Leptospirillum TaxID=179 RepID=UPI000984DAF7|nr:MULTISPECIES: translation initiation factor IF-3 [Leptospirillum]